MKNTAALFSLVALSVSITVGANAQSNLRIRQGQGEVPPVNTNRLSPKTVRPDAAKMISVLKGQAEKPTGPAGVAPRLHQVQPPVVNVIERKSKLADDAAPKGRAPGFSGQTMEIKSGRVPATGAPVPLPLADETQSKTLYMKKGNTPAEGIADPRHDTLPLPEKAGRIAPEGGPIPPRPRPVLPSGGRVLAGGSAIHEGAGTYGSAPVAPRPSEIRYRVDATSQLSTNTVKFVKGGVELADQASYDYLLALSEALQSQELSGERFVVEGHASAEGSDYANLVLSQRRANAIFDFLASRGVAADRLLAVGHGESQARFADHEPDFLRAQDRQVIVFKLAE